MKKYTLLFTLLFISSLSYAKIGRHNFQLNIGGGYLQFYTPSTSYYVYENNSSIILPSFFTTGGLTTLELGYLFHSIRDNNIVHGFDIRSHITFAFLSSIDTYSTKMYGGIDIAYTVGHQFKWGRLMFDFMGVGVSTGLTTASYYTDFFESSPTSSFNIFMNLIIPGMQFIFNNGFTVGWRNKVKLDFFAFNYRPTGFIGWESAVSLGFTIGGGKKPRPPWEIYYDKKFSELTNKNKPPERKPFILN